MSRLALVPSPVEGSVPVQTILTNKISAITGGPERARQPYARKPSRNYAECWGLRI
jgi:hypothetical protein